MAKQADVEFRIRSKDLSAKSIEKITQELQELIDTQERQRTQAAASSATIKALEDDYKKLGAALAEITKRRSVVESLVGKRGELEAAKNKINEVRVELAQLLSMKSRGTFIGDIDTAIKNVRKSLKGADQDFNRTATAVQRLETQLSGMGVNVADTAGALQTLRNAQDQAIVAQARTGQAVRETTAAMNQQQVAMREATGAQQRYQQELAQTVALEQQRAARRGDAEFAFANNQALARQQVLARDAVLRQLEIQRRADAVEKRLADTRRQLTGATSAMTNATGRARREQSLFNDEGRKSLSFMQRQRGQLLSLAAAYFGVFEAINVGARAIQTDIQRQGALIRLQVAEQGDLTAAGREFDFVRQQADRLGQSLTPLANQYSKFKIASEGAGQSAETTRQIFLNFAEAATVLQLSQENVEGIFRALEQSFSKGIVQAEELRGQLGDRLPGAFTKLAAAIGVSNAELNKLLEQGEVSANVLPLLGEFIADEVAGQLPEATNNTRAALERLKTAFDDFLVTISNSGLSDTVRRLATDLTEFFQSADGREFAQDIALAFSTIVRAISSVLSVLGGPSGIINAFKVLIAINVARWVGSFVVGVRASIAQLAAMRTAMVATTASARTMGAAITTALGPISIAITLAAEAFLYFSSQAEAAADAAEEQVRKIDDLRTAHGENLEALIELNGRELEAEKQAYATARAKRAEAQERLRNAEAALAELKAQGQATFGAKGEVFQTPQASKLSAEIAKAKKELVDLNTEAAGYLSKQNRTTAARARAEQEAAKNNEAGIRRVAALQEELSNKANQERLKNDKDYYNDLVKRLRETNRFVNEIPNQRLNATLEDSLANLNQQSSRIRAELAGVNFSSLDKGNDKAAKAAERARLKALRDQERAEGKRIQISDKTKEALLDIEGDIARARVDTDAVSTDQIQANLMLRLQAIDAEIAKRRSDLEALKREALEAGTPESVAQTNAALGQLDQFAEIQKHREREKATLEEMRLLESQMNDLISQRDAELESINTQLELGLVTESQAAADALQAQENYSARIQQRLALLRDFILANQGVLAKMLNVPELLTQLDTLQLKIEQIPTATDRAKRAVAEDFAGGAADAFGALAEGLAGFLQGANSIGDAFKNAGAAFQTFLSNFLIGIGKAIIEAIILQAIMNAITGGKGGYTQAAVSAVGQRHSGGMVGGASARMRRVSPLIFTNAPRYHTGGFPGLRSDEIPIIAQRGEEVLSRADPRNALNGGGSSQPQQLKIINAIDSASVVSEGMNSREGQRALINYIRANRQQVRNELGI